jgi:hypothetical protein
MLKTLIIATVLLPRLAIAPQSQQLLIGPRCGVEVLGRSQNVRHYVLPDKMSPNVSLI